MNPFLADVYESIVDEAYQTKPTYMTMDQAVRILIEERVERNILNLDEARALYEHVEDASE